MPGEDAIVVHDGNVILECNQAFCTLFGCACEGLVGRRMESLIHDPDLQRLAIARGRRIMATAEDREWSQSYVFVRCNSSTFWGQAFSQRIAPGRYRTRVKWEYDDAW
jgi:PAS domain S-box-containing protein